MRFLQLTIPGLRPVLLLVAVLLLCCGQGAHADEAAPRGHSPKICLNHRLKDGKSVWGFGHREKADCPPHHAVYGTYRYAADRWAPAEQQGFTPVCCPLPATDILLADEETTATLSCPEEYVATGADAVEGCDGCPFELRCTKINTMRYRLSEETPGHYWGFGYRFWDEPNRLMHLNLPAAVRYGMGRDGWTVWQRQGCVGSPVGSLVVGKRKKSCYGIFFRELQFAGAEGDPAAGTPVRMYPECDDITDRLDPAARCVKLPTEGSK